MTIEKINFEFSSTELKDGREVRLHEKLTVTVRVNENHLIEVPLLDEAMDRFKKDVFTKASEIIKTLASYKEDESVEKWLTNIIRSNGSQTDISKAAKVLKEFLTTNQQ